MRPNEVNSSIIGSDNGLSPAVPGPLLNATVCYGQVSPYVICIPVFKQRWDIT